ncbi:MAG TPA: hypothetical protein PKY30_15160 [Myxococcota bacterium]|nr:hypothetical protein [Myxococcota bacterium]
MIHLPLLLIACGPVLVRDLDDLRGEWSGSYQSLTTDQTSWQLLELQFRVASTGREAELALRSTAELPEETDLTYNCVAGVPNPGHVRLQDCIRTIDYPNDPEREQEEAPYSELNYLRSAVDKESLFLGSFVLQLTNPA